MSKLNISFSSYELVIDSFEVLYSQWARDLGRRVDPSTEQIDNAYKKYLNFKGDLLSKEEFTEVVMGTYRHIPWGGTPSEIAEYQRAEAIYDPLYIKYKNK